MIENPVKIRDYIDPIECVKKKEIYDNRQNSTEKINTHSKINSQRSDYDFAKESHRTCESNKSDIILHSAIKNSLLRTVRENIEKNNLINRVENPLLTKEDNPDLKLKNGFPDCLKIPKLNLNSLQTQTQDDEYLENEHKGLSSKNAKKSRNLEKLKNTSYLNAKSTLKENKYKTHFKAASDFTIFNSNYLLIDRNWSSNSQK